MQSGVGVDRERRYLKGGGEGSGVFRGGVERGVWTEIFVFVGSSVLLGILFDIYL